ncbi:hypothetical protein GGH94_005661, partial [Coemansia aciculifera]
SKTDKERLKQSIADRYADGSTVDWNLAGAYTNVDALECQRVGLGTFSDTLNNVGYRRICDLYDSGLSWKDIHQRFLQYLDDTSLQRRYHRLKRKLDGQMGDSLTAEWTDSEREQMGDDRSACKVDY